MNWKRKILGHFSGWVKIQSKHFIRSRNHHVGTKYRHTSYFKLHNLNYFNERRIYTLFTFRSRFGVGIRSDARNDFRIPTPGFYQKRRKYKESTVAPAILLVLDRHLFNKSKQYRHCCSHVNSHNRVHDDRTDSGHSGVAENPPAKMKTNKKR